MITIYLDGKWRKIEDEYVRVYVYISVVDITALLRACEYNSLRHEDQ